MTARLGPQAEYRSFRVRGWPEDEDDIMTLPKAVQAQLDAAEAAEAAMQEQGQQAADPEGSDTEAGEQEAEGQDTANRAEETPPRKRTDWKRKYMTLEGKYRAEVPALIQQVRSLEAELEKLREKATEGHQNNAPDISDVMGLFTPEQREEFGDDLLALVAQTAKKVAAQETKPAQEKAEQAQLSAEELRQLSYETQLDTATQGKWRQLDTDPAFIEWLQESEDPYTGKSLFEVINEHHAQMNAPVVARIFNQYIQSQPAPRRKNERVAQPAAHRASAPEQAGGTQGRVFKESEVRRIYTRAAVGKIPADKFAELEREIEAAAREGRIIKG